MMKKCSLIVLSIGMLLINLSYGAVTMEKGPWRFEMRAAYANIPFIIDISEHDGKYSGILKNGKEDIPLQDISATNQGVHIPLQTYEVSMELTPPTDGKVSGFVIRHNKDPEIKNPVTGYANESERFPQEKGKPKIDLNGKWAVTITDEQDKTENGVIIFEQKKNDLHGSILTPTGDYRYMEGYVDGDRFEAASFDGMYNYIVKGTLKDGILKADLLANYRMKIQGKKDPKAKLPDPYKETQIDSLKFSFPDLHDKKISLDSPQFQNKPVIVQIFGSWCPNCLDEMNYLIPWYKENNKRGIEIIALSFERSLSPQGAKSQLLRTSKKFDVPYTLLIAGYTSEDKPADKLPGLKNFISFPTTIFLNRKHEVVKVHAGFTGPSTGPFYEKWKKEFNETVNGLLK